MTPWNPTVFSKNIPKECRDKIAEFRNDGRRIVCVAFPPGGGNRWSVITDTGFFNRGIPDECHQKMREFHQAGEKVVSVAFPFAGGNRYTVIGEHGRFFNRNSPRGCHRVMRAMSNCRVGALHMVGFHPDGSYAIVSDASPAGQVAVPPPENGKTFSIDAFAENLRNQLSGKVVKYGFMVRYKNAMRAWAAGPKRTADNPPEQAFTVFDWFNPASVTKVVTGVGLLHCVKAQGHTISRLIHHHLPPGWTVPQSVRTITVRELLSHRAGFRGGAIKYADLKALVEAGINPADKAVREYENCNYGLARIVLAMMSGLVIGNDDPEEATAARFRSYMQQHIFDELGVPGVEWKPDSDDPTEFYPKPPGDSAGTSYGDWTLKAGSAGVHLSIAEQSIFVAKLADGNDLLPQALRTQMDTYGLGWDTEGGTHHRKGGYFPGSMNGGAELHAYMGKFANGIQYAAVYNGRYADDDPAPFNVGTAYNAAWT